MPVAVYAWQAGTWRAPGRPALTPPAPTPPDLPGAPGWSPPEQWPTAASAGWQGAGSPTLTPVAAFTSRTPGALIEHLEVDGDLVIEGDGTLVRACVVHGQLKLRAATNLAAEDVDCAGFVVTGTKIARLSRIRTTGALGVDGGQVKTSSAGAVPEAVLIEDCAITAAAVDASSHYDGIQVRGVRGLTIRGCNIDPGETIPEALWHRQAGSVFLENAGGGNHDVVIEHNRLRSVGHRNLLLGHADGLTIRGNVFAHGGYAKGPWSDPTWITEATGNVWEDDGDPIEEVP